jgi:hypothetical protein
VKRKVLIALTIAALMSLAVACNKSEEANTANLNNNANNNLAATNTTTNAAPDNSEITTTTDSNGAKVETRTFRSNQRVSRVVVTTRDGSRTVKVYSPSGEEREMKSEPEKALSATGDAIADSVGFVKDKSADVGEKTKDVSKDVIEKTGETAKTVGNKTVDTSKKVTDTTVDKSKTVVGKTKQGTSAVVDKTKEGVRKTGKAIKKVIP